MNPNTRVYTSRLRGRSLTINSGTSGAHSVTGTRETFSVMGAAYPPAGAASASRAPPVGFGSPDAESAGAASVGAAAVLDAPLDFRLPDAPMQRISHVPSVCTARLTAVCQVVLAVRFGVAGDQNKKSVLRGR
ncbi:hypothetical protein GCM10010842_17490 [Deinococcus daejeonensis]|uniref:Uncharacterized protein n=1 Tax=Deinococcus daejeonensis TaxID=1007098 RepID=A0ABQ2J1K4_9DEIO|nr:hypothetical protein GCM10010842_17490 [Deinococcus daejeonensis]